MYALCPECNSSQLISPKQLKKKQGRVICASCAHKFNALPSLSDVPHKDIEPIADNDLYPWQIPTRPRPILWLTGSLLGLAAFAYQVYYFTGYPLSQNTYIRPLLSSISTRLHYPLPDYHKLSDFTVVGSAFKRTTTNDYRLQLHFINHADFSQALPFLQLTLQNLHGGVFAQRTFSPQEYLEQANPPRLMNRSASLEIDLFIAAPTQSIGGYSIELK